MPISPLYTWTQDEHHVNLVITIKHQKLNHDTVQIKVTDDQWCMLDEERGEEGRGGKKAAGRRREEERRGEDGAEVDHYALMHLSHDFPVVGDSFISSIMGPTTFLIIRFT